MRQMAVFVRSRIHVYVLSYRFFGHICAGGFYGNAPTFAQQQAVAAAAAAAAAGKNKEGGGSAAEGSSSSSNGSKKYARASADFRSWLTTDLSVGNLPRATRVIFTLLADGKEPVAWAGTTLFDYASALLTGSLSLPLWPGACPTPLTTHLANTYGR